VAGSTLKDARDAYFLASGFGADGGYSDPYVVRRVMGLAVAYPNFRARSDAARLHDLHHMLTGYGTDFPGEVEIAAWELGSGSGMVIRAWVLGLIAIAGGFFGMPRRALAAFARGRRSRNLFGETYSEALLARSAEQTRRELRLDVKHVPTLGDAVLFAPYVVAAVAFTFASFAFLPLTITGLLAGMVLARRIGAGSAPAPRSSKQ
jgi:hypothetical protein